MMNSPNCRKGCRRSSTTRKNAKKLVVYINPPYAEVSSKAETGKVGVNLSKIHSKYGTLLGTAGRELFAQFLVRIYSELNGAIVAEFSKLKLLQGPAFLALRAHFQAQLNAIFLAPAYTFDNVKGQFPIGFKIWDTGLKEQFISVIADVYDKNTDFIGTKELYALEKGQHINKFISLYKGSNENAIGFMDGINANDFQHHNIVYVLNTKEQAPNPRGLWINSGNLIPVAIYFSVRKAIEANWLNDRDQFLFPNDGWKTDEEFQNDCLTFTLFNNNIQSKFGANHWIPFTESEVNAGEKFESSFMTDFIDGKITVNEQSNNPLFEVKAADKTQASGPRQFSAEAKAVFDAGRELWRYYHSQANINVNASLYDIREYFQGRNDKGRMNSTSPDAEYTKLITDLRQKLNLLAAKIAPKVYEHGFLKK